MNAEGASGCQTVVAVAPESLDDDKEYARPGLDKQRLGQIINLVSDIALGSTADRAKDTLGRVYEYFLARFASAEGKSGGQFYTPSHVVRVLVEMLAPYKGRVYDPCCGSGGIGRRRAWMSPSGRCRRRKRYLRTSRPCLRRRQGGRETG